MIRVLTRALCLALALGAGSGAAWSQTVISGDLERLFGEWGNRTPSADPVRRNQAEQDELQERITRHRRSDALEDAQKEGAKKGFERAGTLAERAASALGWAGGDGGDQLRDLAALLGEGGHNRSAEAVRAVRRALQAAKLVDPDDGGGESDGVPDGVPDGQPGVPSACAAVDSGPAATARRHPKPGARGRPAPSGHPCEACYSAAIDALDATRTRLEKLRAIYTSTYRSAKNLMAFADGVSAVHGVSALAWQRQKIEVLKSLKNLDKAYDAKYAELMQALMKDLSQYSECEEKVMKVASWYDRYGFVYYQFMKDHYKRPTL